MSDLSKSTGLLRKKHLLPYSSRVLFYNCYILPRIDYYLPIWGKASAIHLLDKIWRLQKRAFKTVLTVFIFPSDTPTHDLFRVAKRTPKIPVIRSNSSPLLLYVSFTRKETFKQSLIQHQSKGITWLFTFVQLINLKFLNKLDNC